MTPISFGFMLDISKYLPWFINQHKPTYNWGAPPCRCLGFQLRFLFPWLKEKTWQNTPGFVNRKPWFPVWFSFSESIDYRNIHDWLIGLPIKTKIQWTSQLAGIMFEPNNQLIVIIVWLSSVQTSVDRWFYWPNTVEIVTIRFSLHIHQTVSWNPYGIGIIFPYCCLMLVPMPSYPSISIHHL